MLTSLDHLVLTVKDIEKSIDFYTEILGMKKEIFKGTRVALKYGCQKINLNESGNEFEPKALHVTPGSADLCFLTDMPLEGLKRCIEAKGVTVLEGPVKRTGAQGEILSVYVRDPDGNLIEIANQL